MRQIRMSGIGFVVVTVAALVTGIPAAGEAGGRPAAIRLVSVSTAGGPSGGGAAPLDETVDVSASGRHVLFTSFADNLVPGDNNGLLDVFVRDMANGRTDLVSVGVGGVAGNDVSWTGSISANGRYVAFQSSATNLVPGWDGNGYWDVFVRDLWAERTQRVSVSSSGEEGDQGGGGPDISADGRHVVFGSNSANLAPGDTNDAPDVFVHELDTGRTELVSLTATGGQVISAWDSSISADGRYVAFTANNAGERGASGYLRDRLLGTTRIFSAGTPSIPGAFATGTMGPEPSPDGRYVAFTLVSDVGAGFEPVANVWRRDLRSGALRLVSADPTGRQATTVGLPHQIGMSDDGRYVAFGSPAQLLPADRDTLSDIYLRDLRTGALRLLTGAQADPSGSALGSIGPAISADGRRVAFEADTVNLAPGDRDPSGGWDAYLWTAR